MGKNSYECCICKRKGIKLWRPYMGVEPLVCATCAEDRQLPREYEERKWEKVGDKFIGTPTGKTSILPRWEINAKGKIPTEYGIISGMSEEAVTTDQLQIKFKDTDEINYPCELTLIPAVPDGHGEFWGYLSVPEDLCKWWEKLPNK